jgi:probable rRNA maturation factor
MEIALENLQKKAALNPPQILKVAKTILRHEGVQKASLSIVFVTRQRIKALNKKFLHRDHSTDVLAFDLRDGAFLGRKEKRKLKVITGDIIISTDAAWKNSRIYGTALSQELALYIIHGILHLLGFDDHRSGDIKKMRKKEQEILSCLGAMAQKIVR